MLIALLITYIAVIFFITLIIRVQASSPRAEWIPLWSWYEVLFHHDRGLFEEIWLNVVLFVPVGVLLTLLYELRPSTVFYIGFGFSAFIEFMQLITCRGLFEWDDMLHNALGCLLGYGLVRVAMKDIHMRLKYRIKEALLFLAFAFYPKTTLIACAVFSMVVIAILGIMMAIIPQQSGLYNIVFALTTGAAASFFVSIVVELADNYKHNKLAWHELQEYYSVVMNYELNKQAMMQSTPPQRAEKKAHEEFIAAGGVEEIDENDKPKDIIQITWEQLPEIIPVFRQTLSDKKEFMSEAEINELKNISLEYKEIRFVIQERILMSSMEYDALNHPDEDYLKLLYPADVIRNMPEWMRRQLASKESKKACELYAETILSDTFLLSQFMENYDISQNAFDRYQNEIDKLEEMEEHGFEDIDYEERDFSEPDDEETFRAKNEEFDNQMELENRPFISGLLSKCCKNISESIDILEESIYKKTVLWNGD
ncbi:MAG: VanZ family protein [Lachnospiraceae bacterium]|nr:VanZ family protein [Lachnospiraceae bacterium]